MNRKSFFGLVAVTLVLGGCATSPTEQMIEQQAQIQEARLDAQQAHIERENEKREAELDVVPDWYLGASPVDGTGLYAVASGSSKQLEHAFSIAKLRALKGLAEQVESEVSSQDRLFEKGGADGEVVSQTTVLIDKLVPAISTVGHEVVQKEVIVLGGKYSAYLQLKLPFEAFNPMSRQKGAKGFDAEVNAAFDSMYLRIKQRKEEEEASAKAEHERKEQALDARMSRMAGKPEVESAKQEGESEE